MLKRALILLVLALSGCSQSGQNIGPYEFSPLLEEGRLLREGEKREFLQLEDLVIGTGSLAAQGRRLTADIEARYTDGTVVYRGPILSFPGFVALVGTIRDSRLLSSEQKGIDLGLNGMAVGGRRRMIIDKQMVCASAPQAGISKTQCQLIGHTFKDEVLVRKETLIVEATLTESCNPVITWQALYLFGDYMIKLQACRKEPLPQIIPGAPIWHYY
jgi:hypothetical protein